MAQRSRVHRPFALGVSLACAVFAIDLTLPRGVAAGALHVLALLSLLRTTVAWHVPALTAVCTTLLIVDVPLSAEGMSLGLTTLNRGISLLIVGLAGLQIELRRRAFHQHAEIERRATELFRLALNAAPDAMLVVDAGGVVRVANGAATTVFGYPQADLIGRPLSELLLEEDQDSLIDTASGSRSDRPVRHSQGKACRRDGAQLPVECGRSAFNDGQDRTIVAVRDISERARFEERLRATQRMEAIGKLAGGIAHDFNNLLTIVATYARFIEEAVAEDSRARGDAREILVAADRANSLTRQLLAFSRRQVIEPRVVNAAELVASLARMLERLLGSDIQLEAVTGVGLWPVRVDPTQIEQVLLNLVVNARHAMPNGGKLTIELANVVLNDEYCAVHPDAVPGDYALLAVTDTGVGMNAEVRARAFEPFFTTRPVGTGSGLGLSTVYGIVKQAGGHVWIYSEPGHGTTFKVYLPRAEGAAESLPSRNPAPRPRGGNEHVFVVEDERAVREMVTRVLRNGGYTVVEAGNGLDALRMLETLPAIDLLITDVVMPQMGGRELANKVIAQRPSLRVLYMSGYTENAIVHQGVLDSGLVFIQKPFTPDELLRRVRELLDAE